MHKCTMSAPHETLRALLSTRAPTPTSTTSTARGQERPPAAATDKPPSQYFRIIGRGTCGTIYEHSARPAEVAIKVGSDRASLKRDFNHALRAFNASRSCCSCLQGGALARVPLPLVPKPRRQLNERDLGSLTEKGLRLEALDAETCVGEPKVYRCPEIPSAWEGERIGAVAAETRDALVDLYVAPGGRESVRAEDESRDCLIRVYLGAVSPPGDYHLDVLRNAPLYLDQMKDLGLDVTALAEEMAMGLAMCHWGAELDGMDVELVLGAPRTDRYKDRTELGQPQPGARMWMLDYDKTTLVSRHGNMWKDEQMVQKFAVAAHANDPYFPRPSLDRALWQGFVQVYTQASRVIIAKGSGPSDEKMQRLLDLPGKVMAALQRLYEGEEGWRRNAKDLVCFDKMTGKSDQGWGSDETDSVAEAGSESSP